MNPMVYIDTSVIGGYLDEEFRIHSGRLFADFQADRLKAVVSDVTLAELRVAPATVLGLLKHPALQSAERVFLDEEAVLLSDAYIDNTVVGPSQRVDAQHIAIATVQRVDILVSWNFAHIVKWSRIRGFNSVNLERGYPPLEIRSPREVYYEDETET